MALNINLDWEEDDRGDGHGRRPRRRGVTQQLPAGEAEQYMWFNTFVRLEDVVEATEHPTKYEYTVTGRKRVKPGSRTTTLGTRVVVNGVALALFKYNGELFAIQNTCPHQGASLHLGDIEDFHGTLCVSCPRHKWPFSLEDGDCMVPVDLRAECYPVEVRRQTASGANMLFVGFDSFSDSLFSDEDF